ncbi:hypothetical protein GW17_00034032 [Ensete ventricosum]|nr:hypothetical protein GW17_00034032 [Ensete ventricosum]
MTPYINQALVRSARRLGSGKRLGGASLKHDAWPFNEALGPRLASPKRLGEACGFHQPTPVAAPKAGLGPALAPPGIASGGAALESEPGTAAGAAAPSGRPAGEPGKAAGSTSAAPGQPGSTAAAGAAVASSSTAAAAAADGDPAATSARPRTTGPPTWLTQRGKLAGRKYGGASGRTADRPNAGKADTLTRRRMPYRKHGEYGGSVRQHGKPQGQPGCQVRMIYNTHYMSSCTSTGQGDCKNQPLN